MTDPRDRPVPVASLSRHDDWRGVRAVVAGFDEYGAAAADNLLFLGAQVTALDVAPVTGAWAERADLLRDLGATIRLEPGATDELPAPCDLLVVGPGWAPTDPLVVAALERGIAVWSDLELAWHLRDGGEEGVLAPWLVIAGEQGRALTAAMTASILTAAGLTPVIAGAQSAVVETVMDPSPRDVVIVDASPEQLRFTTSMAAESAVVLNVAPSLDLPLPGSSQRPDSAPAYAGVSRACIYNVAEPATRDLVEEADVVEGARGIGITLAMPSVGMLGVVEDILVDRAFIAERSTSAAELCTLADLGGADALAPDVVTAALAAAALCRAHGVSQQAVRDGLRAARDALGGFDPLD